MGLGVGLILIAVGAVLAFAVHVTTRGFNVNTIGFILLGVGILGSRSPSGRAGPTQEESAGAQPS